MGSLKPVTFGLAIPAFASPGAGLFRTPNMTRLDAKLCLDLAREADSAGFSALWSPDHLMIGRDDAVLEGWTLLSAIAAITKNVRLGLIQQSNLFRAPGVLAKAAATLDVLSEGRLTLCYNYGNKREETEAFGLDYPPSEVERVERAGEALDIMRRLWATDTPLEFKGKYYRLSGGLCRPRPQGTLPVWLAGIQPDNLDLLARAAQGWCTPPVSLTECATRLDKVSTALKRHGRRLDEIDITLETQILIAANRDELRQQLSAIIALDPDGSLSGRPPLCKQGLDAFISGRTDSLPALIADKWLIGTQEEVVERLNAYAALGVNHFILWFMDLPNRKSLTNFIEQVMPQFSAL